MDGLLQKVWDGGRISSDEAVRLFDLPLTELGALADRRRQLAKARAYGGRGNAIVTFSVDRNINYTNICCVGCRFCAFWRSASAPDAYVISLAELDRKIEGTLTQGGTQILLQGGHHPALPKQWYLDLLAHIRDKFPQLNVHGFSPPEFIHFRDLFDEPVERLLAEFKAAGLGSIPGGGAEILVDRVRRQISPCKATTAEWLEVMETAHRLGLYSSATMMFGHVETLADRIEHLERLRALQDRSLARAAAQAPLGDPAEADATSTRSNSRPPGLPPDGVGRFTAFIGWTFQPENTRLRLPAAGAHDYLRTQALARIYLDNFDNVQSSWVTQGPAIGQVALRFGANDLGSVMIEENVVRQAGACFRMSVADMKRLIRDLGYEPRQRDNWYRLVD